MKYYFLLPILLCTFFSCTKEDTFQRTDQVFKPMTGQEYLDNYHTPDILFHYAIKNNLANKMQGVFVNNSGMVYTYVINEPSVSLNADIISSSDMYYFQWKATETEIQLDIDQLVENYKAIRKVKNSIDIADDDTPDIEEFYLAYDLTYDDYSHGGECGGIGSSQMIYKQVLLKKDNTINSSLQNNTIIEWMTKVLDYQLNQ